MPEQYTDLNNLLKPGCAVKVTGQVFVAPEPSVRLGLKVMSILTLEGSELKPRDEYKLFVELCGPMWDEMYEAGVPHSLMIFAGRAVLVYYGISPRKALDYVEILDPTLPQSSKTRRRLWRLTSRRRATTARQTPAVARGSSR